MSKKNVFKRFIAILLVLLLSLTTVASPVLAFDGKDIAPYVGNLLKTKINAVAAGYIYDIALTGIKYVGGLAIDNIFPEIANLLESTPSITLSDIAKKCDEILDEIGVVSSQITKQSDTLHSDIIALESYITKHDWSTSVSGYTQIITSYTDISNIYLAYIKAGSDYAQALQSENSAEMKKQKGLLAYYDKQLSEKLAEINFDKDISAIANIVAKYIPNYLPNQDARPQTPTGADTTLDLASSVCDLTFAFEHQKYEMLEEQADAIMGQLTILAVVSDIANGYYGAKTEDEDELSNIALRHEQTTNRVIQLINDVATQVHDKTKNLMRPSDVNIDLNMRYMQEESYVFNIGAIKSIWNPDYYIARPTLTSTAASARVMEAYQVKAIGQQYPVAILKRNDDAVFTHETLQSTPYFQAKYETIMGEINKVTTASQDYRNIIYSTDGYTLIDEAKDITKVINPKTYSLTGTNLIDYLNVTGEITEDLPKNVTTALTSTWANAEAINFNQRGGPYSEYPVYFTYNYVQNIKDFSIFQTDEQFSETSTITQPGDRIHIYDSAKWGEWDNVKTEEPLLIYEAESNPSHTLSHNSAGTIFDVEELEIREAGETVDFRFKHHDKFESIQLVGNDGTIIDTLLTVDRYELLEDPDADGMYNLSFTMPYQDCTIRVNYTRYYDVWVGGTQVTSINKDNVLGDTDSPTVVYTPVYKDTPASLTLYNANITEATGGADITSRLSRENFGIYTNEDLVINLEGNNTIDLSGITGLRDSYGIYSTKVNLTINGESGATLSVNSGDGEYPTALSPNGIFTLNSGEVTLQRGTGQYSTALDSHGSVVINDGSLTVQGGESTRGNSYGISIQSTEDNALTVNGGTLISTGGSSASFDSYGIWTNKNITVNGGVLDGIGSEAKGSSYGIYCHSLNLNGGHTTGESAAAETGSSIGIHTDTANAVVGFGAHLYSNSLDDGEDDLAISKKPETHDDHEVTAGDSHDSHETMNADEHDYHNEKSVAIYSEFDITFDANGGELSDEGTVSDKFGMVNSLPVPTREGYLFKGWYANDVQVTVDTVFQGHVTLVAKWQKYGIINADNNNSSDIIFEIESESSDSHYNINIEKDFLKNQLSQSMENINSPHVVIDIVSTDAESVATGLTATIDAADIETLIVNNGGGLSIKAGDFVLSYDNTALKAIIADGGEVMFEISRETTLTAEQQDVIGENAVYTVGIYTSSEDGYVDDFGGGISTVTVPHIFSEENSDDVKTVHVDLSGEVNSKNTTIDKEAGTVTFETSHYSTFSAVNNYSTGITDSSAIDGGIILWIAILSIAVLSAGAILVKKKIIDPARVKAE